MNIDEQWKNMEESKDADLSSLLKMQVISRLPSKDPLQKIKNNLIIHSAWALLIGCAYIFIIIRFPFWQIIVCLGIVLLFTVWAIIKSVQLYKKIEKNNPANTLLQQMESHYNNIKQWMDMQEKVGLIIYPVCAAGGFMLGGFLGSGKPIGEIMQKPSMIIALLIAIAILEPCGFYAARWMNRKSFGQYADALKKNIDTLKNEK